VTFASLLATLSALHLVAVISPGPNFVIVSSNAIERSRSTGMWTAIGVGAAAVVYMTAGFVGLAAVIARSTLAFNLVRFVGAAYFAYMGVSAVVSALRAGSKLHAAQSAGNRTDGVSPRRAGVVMGLLTSLSNPKAVLYYLALFTTFVPPSLPIRQICLIGAVLLSISLTWYGFVAFVFSTRKLREVYRRWSRPITGLFGLLWMGLAVRLILSAPVR